MAFRYDISLHFLAFCIEPCLGYELRDAELASLAPRNLQQTHQARPCGATRHSSSKGLRSMARLGVWRFFQLCARRMLLQVFFILLRPIGIFILMPLCLSNYEPENQKDTRKLIREAEKEVIIEAVQIKTNSNEN